MKKIVIPTVLILSIYVVFTSCLSPGFKIHGNGRVIEENREVYEFRKIKIDGVVNVHLIQGEKEEVRVETDENLQPYIHVYTTGNTLVLDTEDGRDYKFTRNEIYVTFVNLEMIEMDGVGNLKCADPLNIQSLTMEKDGVGSADILINCEELKIKQGGVGNLNLSGNANIFELRNTGVGSVNAYNLVSNYADVKNTGVGSTEVNANKEISIHSTGVGSVKYRGSAVIKEINASGIGSVKKTD